MMSLKPSQLTWNPIFYYLKPSIENQIKLGILHNQMARSIPIYSIQQYMYFWEDFHWVSADIGLFINLFTLFAITYNITAIYYNCERKQEKFNGEETS